MFITANRSRRATFRLVTDALFAALYVVLAAYLTVKLPVMEISLSTLPLLLAGFLFGPIDAVTVALIGSFLEQALSQYGLTPSAPLWMLPPILLALVAGLLGLAARRLPAGQPAVSRFAGDVHRAGGVPLHRREHRRPVH